MRDVASMSMQELIEIGYQERASDVFVKGGQRPMMRQHAQVKPLPGDFPVLSAGDAQRLIEPLMNEKQRRNFEDNMEMDLAFAVGEFARVRANIHMQRGAWGIVCRIIPLQILAYYIAKNAGCEIDQPRNLAKSVTVE